MIETFITSDFWISAYRKKLSDYAIPIYVKKSGHKVRGAIIIKLSLLTGNAILFKRNVNADGIRIWAEDRQAKESEIDEMIEREIRHDSDLWVLEIEDKLGRHFLFEPSMNT